MPNMNGTGPRGEGPMTGRGLGKCQGAPRRRPRGGRGLGRGRGLGPVSQTTDNEDRS